MKILYNTAFKSSGSLAHDDHKILTETYRGNNLTVFQHDICKGVNKNFIGCDALHTELAWKDGYHKFVDGTIAENTDFIQYIDSIVNVCRELCIPSFIVCGKSMLGRLKPDRSIEIKYTFHNYKAYYAIYNYGGEMDGVFDEFSGRDWVCRNFTNILDPCCGYGIIANDILKYHKHGVLSDVNATCLEYINITYVR